MVLFAANCSQNGFKTNLTADGIDEYPSLSQNLESSKASGVFDSNCLNNSVYDACLFWKNPVAQNGKALTNFISQSDDLINLQTFGVNLKNLTNQTQLKSTSLNIIATSGQLLTLSNGVYRSSYKVDGHNHYLAQLMAYFWLNYQEERIYSSTQIYYVKDRNITVDAYKDSVEMNAYWDGSKIVMGYAINEAETRKHEVALSAEVYLHEMGHANLDYATGTIASGGTLISQIDYTGNADIYYYCYDDGYIYTDTTLPSGCTDSVGLMLCKTSAGCIGAIHEGQADFHHLMVFHDSPNLFETMFNNINGDSFSVVSRNVEKNKSWSVETYYLKSKRSFHKKVNGSPQLTLLYGEIHDMGAAYASILWSIYTNSAVNPKEFETLFMQHLQNLTTSSQFIDSRNALIAQDLALYGGKYKTIITTAFANRGIK